MPALSDETLRSVLLHGEISLQGQFMLGSNYTFLVNVAHEGQDCAGGLQTAPRASSRCGISRKIHWLDGKWRLTSSARRSAWSFVPFTVLRDEGPFGPGSLQQYIDYNPNYHYFTFKDDRQSPPAPGGAVRPAGQQRRPQGQPCHLPEADAETVPDRPRPVLPRGGQAAHGHLGLCRAAHPPGTARGTSTTFRAALSTRNWLPDLEQYLTPGELTALDARAADADRHSRVFLFPPKDRRAFPYPPL